MSDADPWHFDLPPDRIARHPPPARSDARLLHLPPAGEPRHHGIRDLPDLLRPGDLLVANDSRVVPARLAARRETGGAVELLVLDVGPEVARALARPARKLKVGERLALGPAGGEVAVEVLEKGADGLVTVRFPGPNLPFLEAHGAVPLPPYLEREAGPDDRERYQTVFAAHPGSVAAPTAGLHFDAPLLAALAARGVGFATVTLHVGLGTFRPLRPEDLAAGVLHPEPWSVPEATRAAIASARAGGGRVIAIGTTSARTLESATPPGATLPEAGHGVTTLFLRPPAVPRAFDALVTNFHLPGSSLLHLVATICGRERLLSAYAVAIREGYRFYSYGDAMLVER